MFNEDIITNFGFPDSIKNVDLTFCFDDELAKEKLEYYC